MRPVLAGIAFGLVLGINLTMAASHGGGLWYGCSILVFVAAAHFAWYPPRPW